MFFEICPAGGILLKINGCPASVDSIMGIEDSYLLRTDIGAKPPGDFVCRQRPQQLELVFPFPPNEDLVRSGLHPDANLADVAKTSPCLRFHGIQPRSDPG